MIEVCRADITTLDVDAIVNAANENLAPGGGVCGAIYRGAGPDMQRYTDRLKPCPTGEAVLTPAFGLPARYVIHAVGPVWSGGEANEPQLLGKAYHNAFSVARQNGFRSIAFPAISTGIYGFPMEPAARIAIRAMRHHDHDFDRIIACVFDESTRELYERILPEIPPVPAPVESAGTPVPWLEPTSFEIAMMAKLKTMVPEDVYEALERSRGMAGGSVNFGDPEIQRVWESIIDDRNEQIRQAIWNGTLDHRQQPPQQE